MLVASSIDYGPLTGPVDRAAEAAFRRRVQGDPTFSGNGPFGGFAIIGVGALFLLAGAFFAWPGSVIGYGVGGVAIALGVLALVLGIRTWRRRYRLDAFATRNDLRYYPATGGPAYPGVVFGQGEARFAKDRFVRQTGRTIDYGNYEFRTGSGRSKRTHQWWYLAYRLDRRLPHMIIDSKANNVLFGSTNLPVAFARDQVLHLEGDWDEHFVLYAPKEYERDALYVFTPDLMALCIDEASTWDLEIVEDWLFAYSNQPIDPMDARAHERIWRFVDTVGAKALSRTDDYADERASGRIAFRENVVAAEGVRLRTVPPYVRGIVTVIGAVIVLSILFWPQISAWLGIPY